ncbi:hypothetical protein LCGC14_3058690, partial [marine sediment metagenome]
ALHDRGYRWNVIVGTSVGSINAAAYAMLGPERLSNLWATDVRSNADILSPSGVWRYIKGPYNFMFKGGFYNLDPTRNILNRYLLGKTPTFCEDVYCCKVSLKTGRVVYAHHSEEDFIESILGSSSIPGIMQPVGEWADGALNEHSVIKKAIVEGADRITIILCDQFEPKSWIRKNAPFGLAIKNILRTANVIAHEVLIRDISKCMMYNDNPTKRFIELEVYAPLSETVGTLEFGPKDPHNIWKRGYSVGQCNPVPLNFSEWVEVR